MSVLKVYPTPRGFHVIPIHYTHDPAKANDPAWFEAEHSKYSRETEWMKEMEIDFRSKAGSPAYPSFERAVNLATGIPYIKQLPLLLQCDFNVAPQMVWEVGQLVRGKPRWIEEIVVQQPATVEAAVDEFRNRFPSHRAEVWVYGDAVGHNRNPQTGKSDYALLKLHFRGYAAPLVMKVPKFNPPVKDRLNASNRLLRGADGTPGALIDEEKCPELVRDFEEVVLTDKGNDILKVYDSEDPYSMRTHASDGFGYFASREYPVHKEEQRNAPAPKPAEPLEYKHLLGDLRR